MIAARTISTWTVEHDRLEVRGLRWRLSGRIAPVGVRVSVGDDLAHAIKSLIKLRDHDPDGLQYFLFGRLARRHLAHPHVVFKVDVLQATERALLEHVDLSTRHVCVAADQLKDRHFEFGAHLADQVERKPVQLPSGIVLFHGFIPSSRRLIGRARAAARHQFVDDLVALNRVQRLQTAGAAA